MGEDGEKPSTEQAGGIGAHDDPGLRDFLSQGILPYQALDADGSLASVNDAWVRELGRDRGDVIGRPVVDFVHPEDRGEFQRVLRAALDTGIVPEIEVRLLRGDDHYIVARFSSRAHLGPTGLDSSPRLHLFFSNVTAMKQKEAEALENDRRLKAVVANLPGMVYRCVNRPGYPMLYLGGRVEALTGHHPGTIMSASSGVDYESLIHPEDRERVWEEIQKGIGGGRSFQVEYRIRTASGDSRWVWEQGQAVECLPDGAMVLEGFIADITPRKSAELDLKERNVFIRTILDNLPIGLAVNYISEGTATYMNQAFTKIYGWPREELTDISRFFQRVYPDPEYRKELREKVMEDISSGDPNRMSWEGLKATGQDGQERIIAAKNIPIPEQNFMISTVWDITDEVQAKEDLERTVEALRNLTAHVESVREEEKRTIAREIHDAIGQALTAVQLDLASILGDVGSDSPPGRKLKELTELVRETMTETQRISADLRPNLLEALGLRPALEEFLTQVQERSGIRTELEFDFDDDALDDDQKLQVYRLIQEACTNTVRHAGAGRLEVAITCDEERIQIQVQDDGRGIRQEEVEDPKAWGLTGMRERALALGGEFQIQGSSREGTAVTISFPVPSAS